MTSFLMVPYKTSANTTNEDSRRVVQYDVACLQWYQCTLPRHCNESD